MDLKRQPKFLYTYLTPITVAVGILLSCILFIFLYNKKIVQESTLSTVAELSTETATTSVSYILPKRTLPDFERIITTVDQEIAFEQAMVQEEDTLANTIPEISDGYFTGIKKTLDSLPADDQKNFCQKFAVFSNVLNEELGETREDIEKLFDTKEKKLREGRSTKEQRVKRNRDLRDTQLNIYFSRLEKLVNASTTPHIDSIRTDIVSTLKDVRYQTDQTSDLFFSGIIELSDTYRSNLDTLFSDINPKVVRILDEAKNECGKGISPRIVRLSVNAGLSVVLNKIFDTSIHNIPYPKEQLSSLVQTKNVQQNIQSDVQTALKKRLVASMQSIPKK